MRSAVLISIIALIAGVLLAPNASLGQAAPSGVGSGPTIADRSDETTTPTIDLSGPRGEIALRVVQFGTGQAARAGDWFGLQVEVIDSGAKPRNVLIRLAIRDPDGDIANIERTAVINPGVKQTVWLYARMPATAGFRANLDITAHEAIALDGARPAGTEADAGSSSEAAGVGAGQSFEAGRLLGRTRYPINNLLPSHVATWAIIGDRPAGLEQYPSSRLPGRQLDSPPPDGHVLIELSRGLILNALPDRWMGLAQFDLIAWTTTAREQPSQLTDFQARAIREWVRRGGHLVVLLPPAGQPWIGAGASGNPLADLMPTVSVTRLEGVNLEAYRPLLTREPTSRLPSSATVHQFRPRPDSDAYTAIPILNGPDGQPLVVRRLVGAGSVTLIGLDLTSAALGDSAGSFQADILWNRVIGLRAPAYSPSEIAQRDGAPDAQSFTPRQLGGSDLDTGLGRLIQMQGKAAAGLLLAFFVFGAYWLIAGPVGYFGLKAKGKRHHSWLAFAATTAAFTLIAWLGATLLKGRSVEVRHVTVLDHVYGQSNQRARSWLNVYFPTYGDAAVRLNSADGFGNVLSTWESPDSSAGAEGSAFPDARGYTVDARLPDSLPVPIRATAKQFQADWAGVTADWGMPRPVFGAPSADGATSEPISAPPLGSEIRILPRTRNAAIERDWQIQGVLTHNLPGPLLDTLIVVNLGQNPSRIRRAMFADAFARRVTAPWNPGQPLDLSDNPPPTTLGPRFPLEMGTLRGSDSLARWLELSPFQRENIGFGAPSETDTKAGLLYASFLGMTDVYASGNSRTAAWLRRHATHGMDLSRWLTQPCIIIIGRLEDVPCPLPVSIDGRPLPGSGQANRGTVVVRWVYPLPSRPPEFVRSGPEQPPDQTVPTAPAQPESPQ